MTFPHPVPDEDPERHIGAPVPDPWAEHDRLMRDRARLILDGVTSSELAMPATPDRKDAG